MPAKVTVQSGISAGTTHWIERPVVRIGSDPQSDLCLPSADVATHALTLEFRDGEYRVYNRCRSNVFLGRQAVAPGQARVWSDAETLQLNDDIELVLDLEEDPAPVRTKRSVVSDEFDDEELASEGIGGLAASDLSNPLDKPQAKFLAQLIVTILCFAGCAGLLAREAMKGSDNGPTKRRAPVLAEVIRNASSSNTSPALIQRLQFAEAASVRGNKTSARKRFGSLRDDLLPLQRRFASESRAPELAILDFVEYRLDQLER